MRSRSQAKSATIHPRDFIPTSAAIKGRELRKLPKAKIGTQIIAARHPCMLDLFDIYRSLSVRLVKVQIWDKIAETAYSKQCNHFSKWRAASKSSGVLQCTPHIWEITTKLRGGYRINVNNPDFGTKPRVKLKAKGINQSCYTCFR